MIEPESIKGGPSHETATPESIKEGWQDCGIAILPVGTGRVYDVKQIEGDIKNVVGASTSGSGNIQQLCNAKSLKQMGRGVGAGHQTGRQEPYQQP